MPGAREDAGDRLRQRSVGELARREVDVDRERRLVGASGRARCCQCAVCRHAVSSTHAPIGTMSPVSSASAMNSAGGSSPRSGWFQRTSASKPMTRPVAQLDDRLVVQHELVAVERAVQVVARSAARRPRGRGRRLEHLDACPAVVLRLVHRGVGVAEQRRPASSPSLGDRDADARGHEHLARRRSRIGSAIASMQPLGDRSTRPRSSATSSHSTHELVAAEAGDQVAGAQRRRAAAARRRRAARRRPRGRGCR